MRVDYPLSFVRVILKDVTHPGNIGAVARAMKTMGLSQLALVSPRSLMTDPEAQAMATGATDILEQARVFSALPDALADCTHAFAYTARRRDLSPVCLTPRQAGKEALQRIQAGGRCALVFGGERAGLENDDVRLCRFAVEIPTSPQYTSLNLAQAVQIAAYEMRQSLGLPAAGDLHEAPTQAEFDGMMAHWQEAFTAIDLPKNGANRLMLPRLQQLLLRAEPDKKEVRLLRGICRAILQSHKAD